MIIYKRQLYMFISLLIFIIVLIPYNISSNAHSILPMTSFWFIGFFSILMISNETKKHIFICTIFHWIFCLFFFFVAPYIQFSMNKWTLLYKPTEQAIIKTNFAIIIWMLCFFIGSIVYSKKNDKNNFKLELKEEYIVQKKILSIFNAISFVLVLYMISRAGFVTIISSRSGGESAFNGAFTSISSLMTYCVRNFITFTALFNAYRYKRKKDNVIMMIFSLILLLIGCSPIGMPRFQVATVYIALLLIFFTNFKKKPLFILLLIFAFMVLFPVLDAFRYNEFDISNLQIIFKNTLSNLQNQYLSANYDAYVMIMKTFDFVSNNSLQYGRQLLGAFLFFIPRNLWFNKPVSTGTMIQNSFGFYRDAANVSSSLISESYVDFGFIGIVVYALLFGIICKKIDNKILEYSNSNKIDGLLLLLMPTLIFFLCRGPLLSVWGFVSSFIVIGKIMSYIAKKVKLK